MNKKFVVITLLLTALFAVGGIVLETHSGGFSISEDYWTLSVSASAGASGACASASPYIPGWKDLTGNVDENGHGNMDAMPKIYHCSGSATVKAKRDGYWALYRMLPPLPPIPLNDPARQPFFH